MRRAGDVDSREGPGPPLFKQRLVGKHEEIALRGLDANHVLGQENSNQFPLPVHPEVCIRRAGSSRIQLPSRVAPIRQDPSTPASRVQSRSRYGHDRDTAGHEIQRQVIAVH